MWLTLISAFTSWRLCPVREIILLFATIRSGNKTINIKVKDVSTEWKDSLFSVMLMSRSPRTLLKYVRIFFSVIPHLVLFVTSDPLRHQTFDVYYECLIWPGARLWTFSSRQSGWIGYWGLFPLLTVTRVISVEAPDSSSSHLLLWHQSL